MRKSKTALFCGIIGLAVIAGVFTRAFLWRGPGEPPHRSSEGRAKQSFADMRPPHEPMSGSATRRPLAPDPDLAQGRSREVVISARAYPSGRSVEGVEVRLSQGSGEAGKGLFRASTGPRGVAVLTFIPPEWDGDFRVDVGDSKGLALGFPRRYSTIPASIEIFLANPMPLEGVVLDQRGRVVPGAKVALTWPVLERAKHWPKSVGLAESDSDGRVNCQVQERIRAGSFLAIHHPGYLPTCVALNDAFFGRLTTRHVWYLSSGVSLEGRVMDRSGRGIPDAHAYVQTATSPFLPAWRPEIAGVGAGEEFGLKCYRVVTDEHGCFVCSMWPEGRAGRIELLAPTSAITLVASSRGEVESERTLRFPFASGAPLALTVDVQKNIVVDLEGVVVGFSQAERSTIKVVLIHKVESRKRAKIRWLDGGRFAAEAVLAPRFSRRSSTWMVELNCVGLGIRRTYGPYSISEDTTIPDLLLPK